MKSETHTSADSNSIEEPNEPTKQKRSIFLGLCIGNFLVLLDTSILNVALPDVQRTLSASNAQLPWAAVSYTIAFAGLLLASGAFSDRFGAKRVYCSSLLGFAVASLLCAVSPTIIALISARVLLGVTAAAMVPSSLALLAALNPDPGSKARAIGTWAALTSSGLLLGPVLGGMLVTMGGWRLIFMVNPPIAIIAFALTKGLVNARPPRVRPLDTPGIILSIVVLTSATYGLIDGGTTGWVRVGPWVALGIAMAAAIILAVVERQVAHPVLPLALVRRGDLSSSIFAASAATLVFYGILYSLTLWMQEQQNLSPWQTGLSFIPMTLPMCFLPIYTGKLVARFNARKVILVGLVCDVLAGVFLLAIGMTNSNAIVWIVAAEVALVLASTTVIPAATAFVSIRATPDIAGAAQGTLNAGRQAGSALGVAILGPLTSLSIIGNVLTLIAVGTFVITLIFGKEQLQKMEQKVSA